MMMFNIGDKVRILDVRMIDGGSELWKTGDVVEIVNVCPLSGFIYLNDYTRDGLILLSDEMQYIEKVSENITHGGGNMIRKVKVITKAENRKALLAEQDYLLASLSDAISTQDTEMIAKDKARLAEINTELEAL